MSVVEADANPSKITEIEKPPGVLAGQLFKLANEYFDAFYSMSDDELPSSRPVYFILAHAIELILKSYIVAKSGYRSLIRIIGHDLPDLLRCCEDFEIEDIGMAKAFIMHIDHMNDDNALRYPSDYILSMPKKAECKAFMQLLVNAIERFVESARIHANLHLAASTRHLRPGKFSFADEKIDSHPYLRVPEEIKEALNSHGGSWKKRAIEALKRESTR